MTLRWPWKRRVSHDSLVVSWSDQCLSYVRAILRKDGLYEVRQMGVEQQGVDSTEEFLRRMHGLGLKGVPARIMLRPEQYQLLQIDAPAVAPDEMRAAARWKIRDMVDMHVDDVTLDVMRVGDDQVRNNAQLFVVAAPNAVVREVLQLGQELQWGVNVVDIQETAQRNLQSALARREGRLERSDAALAIINEGHALLTISANGELFYSRRIELGAGFLEAPWSAVATPDRPAAGPDYGRGYGAGPTAGAEDLTQRFVMELQRSLDVWDRTWSNLPLDSLRVRAGERSAEMAGWLSQELSMGISVLDVDSMFPGFAPKSAQEQMLCWPLLGALLRTDDRKL